MTLVLQNEEQAVRIPEWVRDLDSFRKWARSDDFPIRGWYGHLNGELWADPSMERLAHNKLKTEFAAVLSSIIRQSRLGQFLGDRMLLTHVEAQLSTEPDGMLVSRQSIQSGRVRLDQGEDSTEIEGAPDMVLEVISPSSRQKDRIVLRDLYWRAGVIEYWLAEAGRDELTFEILKRGPRGFVAVRKHEGWLKSVLFGKCFRLTRELDALGQCDYTLQVR